MTNIKRTYKRGRRGATTRYEVWAHGPRLNAQGTRHASEEHHVNTRTEAEQIAVAMPADEAHSRVTIDVFQAHDGWQRHTVAERSDGTWTGLRRAS